MFCGIESNCSGSSTRRGRAAAASPSASGSSGGGGRQTAASMRAAAAAAALAADDEEEATFQFPKWDEDNDATADDAQFALPQPWTVVDTKDVKAIDACMCAVATALLADDD